MIQIGFPARMNNWSHIFEVLARVLRDEPEQIFFCSNHGIVHLYDAFVKRTKEWSVEDLQSLLNATTAAISWTKNPNLSSQAIKEQNMNALESLSTRVTSFLPILKLEIF